MIITQESGQKLQGGGVGGGLNNTTTTNQQEEAKAVENSEKKKTNKQQLMEGGAATKFKTSPNWNVSRGRRSHKISKIFLWKRCFHP